MRAFFTVLHSKFKLWHNRIIPSLQYHRLHKKDNEMAQKWMGRLRLEATECKYKEYDALLTEQSINGLNDNGMVDEILKEVAMLEDIEHAASKHVLLWIHRVEAQRVKNQPFMK